MADNAKYPDPPMKPGRGSTRWYETGPAPLTDDLASATLIVRVGMAVNALAVQVNAAARVLAEADQGSAAWTRDLIGAFIMNAAVLFEAVKLAKMNKDVLDAFARAAGHKDSQLEAVDLILDGQHVTERLNAATKERLKSGHRR